MRFRHGEAGYNVIVQKRGQEAFLLFRRSIMGKNFGISRVRGLGSKDNGTKSGASKLLIHQSQLKLTIPFSTEFRAQMACPQSALLHLFL